MLNRLQILRGFAALAVVFSHLEHWNHLVSGKGMNVRVLSVGSFAVCTFFVISGFIIHYSHRKEIGERSHLGSYLIKRSFRIYPAYWLFSVSTVVFAAFAFVTVDGNGSLPRSFAEFVSAVTLVPFAFTNPDCSFLGVGWSLFYELIFYILFSLFFLGKRIGYAVLISYSLLCVVNAFLKLDCFWLTKMGLLFSIGCGIAVVVEKVRLPIAGSRLLIAAGVAVYGLAILVCASRPEWGRGIAAIAATLLVTGTVNLDLARPLQRGGVWVAALTWLGAISYSLYLCHLVVQSVLFRYLGAPRSSILVSLFYVLGPILVASGSYLYFEKYCQGLGRKLCSRLPVRAVRQPL